MYLDNLHRELCLRRYGDREKQASGAASAATIAPRSIVEEVPVFDGDGDLVGKRKFHPHLFRILVAHVCEEIATVMNRTGVFLYGRLGGFRPSVQFHHLRQHRAGRLEGAEDKPGCGD